MSLFSVCLFVASLGVINPSRGMRNIAFGGNWAPMKRASLPHGYVTLARGRMKLIDEIMTTEKFIESLF